MTIWKYEIEPGPQRIKMPIYARPIHVALDPLGKPCMWCVVDDNEVQRWHEVIVAVTGGEAPDLPYVGSFILNGFVGHVFFNGQWKITKDQP